MSGSDTANFADDIQGAAGAEPIEGVVIGALGWERDGGEAPEVLAWEDARSTLDYEYDDGYGAPECHAIYAWTASRVVFVSTYDGSTRVTWVPRNPVAGWPDMPGGG